MGWRSASKYIYFAVLGPVFKRYCTRDDIVLLEEKDGHPKRSGVPVPRLTFGNAYSGGAGGEPAGGSAGALR